MLKSYSRQDNVVPTPTAWGPHNIILFELEVYRLKRKISFVMSFTISPILIILPEGPQTTRGTGPDIIYTDYNITKYER